MFGTGSWRHPPPAFHACKRDGEHGDLHAARVELEAEEVVAQHRVLRVDGREAFLLGAHLPEHRERLDEEVTQTRSTGP